MNSVSRYILLFLACGLLASCQSAQKRKYDEMIHSVSQTKKEYSGFHQAFEATMTPMTQEVQSRVLEMKAEVLGWTTAELEEKRKKASDDRITHSHFFLRFYSPNVDYNDLHQPDSIWEVYLIVGNQKFDAVVKKDFSKLVDLQAIYPFFDRFSSGYDLQFPIGEASLVGHPHKVVIASTLGKAEFSFQ